LLHAEPQEVVAGEDIFNVAEFRYVKGNGPSRVFFRGLGNEVEREFKVGLLGSEEVPARNTGAFGMAEVELKDLMLKSLSTSAAYTAVNSTLKSIAVLSKGANFLIGIYRLPIIVVDITISPSQE